MTLLTPDLIEKAASAAYHTFCADTGSHGFDEPPQEWVAAARAALQAVLPDVVESAAKVAEGHDPNALIYRWVLARDIRSLLNKEDKANG